MTGAGFGRFGFLSLRFDSSSSNRNSNCSIWRCSFSDFRPNLHAMQHAMQLDKSKLQMFDLALSGE